LRAIKKALAEMAVDGTMDALAIKWLKVGQ
jgi:hypothetical protein